MVSVRVGVGVSFCASMLLASRRCGIGTLAVDWWDKHLHLADDSPGDGHSDKVTTPSPPLGVSKITTTCLLSRVSVKWSFSFN